MSMNISIFETKENYEISISNKEESMSTGYVIGMVLGFIFFLIVGIIMLLLWFVKNVSNNNSCKILISKENWKEDLEKQLLILDTNLDKNKLKKEIEKKLEILTKK